MASPQPNTKLLYGVIAKRRSISMTKCEKYHYMLQAIHNLLPECCDMDSFFSQWSVDGVMLVINIAEPVIEWSQYIALN